MLSAWAVELLALRARGLDRPSPRRARRLAALGRIDGGRRVGAWTTATTPSWSAARRAA
ncbi:MAG: hypothetical protein JNL50_05035 [Phycisphaerae bacterium]|nr:hypothetical protein [Phycisphaerae bacterium]